jgi:hypothetical protein
MSALSSVPAASNADSGSLMVDQNPAQGNSRIHLFTPQQCHVSRVGQVLSDADLCAMSDVDLRKHIAACATRFITAQMDWERSGDFAAIGERDAAWRAEADALRVLRFRGVSLRA